MRLAQFELGVTGDTNETCVPMAALRAGAVNRLRIA